MASSFPFASLCEDLQAKIVACAAASSDAAELHKLHLVSKSIKSICEDSFVLRRTSIGIPLFPWFKWQSSYEKLDNFVDRCLKSGNPEAMYRVGLVKYFHERSDEQEKAEGLQLLADASEQGYAEATQCYGLIQICLGGENKQMGYKLLRPFRIPLESGKALEMEDRWRDLGYSLCWIGRPKMFELKQRYVRENCMCDGATSRFFTNRWALYGIGQRLEDMPAPMACEVCLWDQVLKVFFGF